MATAARNFPHPEPTDENDPSLTAPPSTTTSTATAATTKSAPDPTCKPPAAHSSCTATTASSSRAALAALNNQSKRALGDITNAVRPHVRQDPFKGHPHGLAAKIRRTAARKPVSAASNVARRAKHAGPLAAAAKKISQHHTHHQQQQQQQQLLHHQQHQSTAASPMSTSATLPRRTSDRLAKRAAATAAAVQMRLDFCPTPMDDSRAPSPVHTPCGTHTLPPGVVDIDSPDTSVAGMEAQLATIIHARFLDKECSFMADPQYMDSQHDITIKMRAILIDWLVDVHSKFKLRPETLFLTVNIIDRYLSCTPVLRRKLQLVGVTAMLIASKYEEIYSPEIDDFVYISDKAYTKREIISMEATILNELDFDVTVPYSLTFMRRSIKCCDVLLGSSSMAHMSLATYLIELALPCSLMLTFRPSMIGAAACSLAGRLTRRDFEWDDTMSFYSGGWTEDDLAPCEVELHRLVLHEVDANGTNKLTAVKRKFSTVKFGNIAENMLNVAQGGNVSDMDICNVAE